MLICGSNPPDILLLLEECHDLIEDTVECVERRLADFDHVTILGGMLVEEGQSVGIILFNQFCTVT